MDQPTGDKWISRVELGERLGIPAKTLAEWASRGQGPVYTKFGKYVRYRLSDVIAWENAESERQHAERAIAKAHV